MPRPRQITTVQAPPRIKGFMPLGYYSNSSEPVLLNVEEYESIRLLDYEGLSQVEAAQMMNVSRPTLTRIYLRARKKIAKALTEALQINIEGGNAIYNGDWFICIQCNSRFNSLKSVPSNCALCNSNEIKKMEV